jgi:hypothetical protein
MEEALIVLTLFKSSVLLLLLPLTLCANEIYINQIGDNADIDIVQDGQNNRISTKSTAASNAYVYGKNQTINFTQTGDNNKIGLYKSTYGSDLQTDSKMKAVQTGDDLIMYLDNHGDDNNIDAEQVHTNAIMDLEIDYDDNDVIAKQKCEMTTCNQDHIILNIYTGEGNRVAMGQGYDITTSEVWSYDNQEYGGHFMNVYVSGDNNNYIASQKANNTSTEHSNNSYIYGDYNDVFIKQQHNVDKTLTLYVYNDYNDVNINQQKSGGSQTATISLDGTYGTDLDLTMGTNNTTGAGTYSLSQNCQTVGGCTVSVTQD